MARQVFDLSNDGNVHCFMNRTYFPIWVSVYMTRSLVLAHVCRLSIVFVVFVSGSQGLLTLSLVLSTIILLTSDVLVLSDCSCRGRCVATSSLAVHTPLMYGLFVRRFSCICDDEQHANGVALWNR